MSLHGPPPGWHYSQTVAVVFLILQRHALWSVPVDGGVVSTVVWYLSLFDPMTVALSLVLAIPVVIPFVLAKRALWSGLDAIAAKVSEVRA
jgi:hypothetical protein